MESNDSPEIPDRGETSDIPGLPSGEERETHTHTHKHREGKRQAGGGEGRIEKGKLDGETQNKYLNQPLDRAHKHAHERTLSITAKMTTLRRRASVNDVGGD